MKKVLKKCADRFSRFYRHCEDYWNTHVDGVNHAVAQEITGNSDNVDLVRIERRFRRRICLFLMLYAVAKFIIGLSTNNSLLTLMSIFDYIGGMALFILVS